MKNSQDKFASFWFMFGNNETFFYRHKEWSAIKQKIYKQGIAIRSLSLVRK